MKGRRISGGLTMVRISLVVAAIAIVGLGGLAVPSAAEPQSKKTTGRYLGAAKCKNCHRSKKAGDQHGAWSKMKHAKAFEVLASAEAKKAAKELGIADPQKSAKCLKCHVTAYGVPKKQLSKGFKAQLGVQCESCHGPGEKHFKARFAAAAEEEDDDDDDEDKEYEPLPKGEIVTRPSLKVCLKCHNDEAPTFKAFCLKKNYKKIAHLDPRKKRTAEELAAMTCPCGESCTCKKAECGKLEE